MAELKQYRLHLPKQMVTSVVWAFVVWGAVGLGAIVLEFQISSAVQHADAGISGAGGLLGSSATSESELSAEAGAAIVTSAGELGRSLGNLDAQVATVGPAVRQLGPVLDGLTRDEARLGDAFDAVNRRCNTRDAAGRELPCGTLEDVNRTLIPIRGAFGRVEVAADHEDRNLTTLDRQELELFDDFHGTATRMNLGLDSFDALLGDPNLALTMKNVGSMTSTADQVEAKLARCTLHPTIACTLKSDVIFGAQVGGYLLR